MEIDSVLGNEIVRRLNETAQGEHGRIIGEYLGILQCSKGTLYRELKRYGFESGRKTRADKGARRIGITDDQLRMIAGAIKLSKRKKRRATMPTTVAVEIASRAGEVPKDVCVSTVNRLLRQVGMSKRQQMQNWTTDDHQTPAFHTPLVSAHPNEWHLFDVTPCTQYYFNKKGLRQRDENLQLYGGKLRYFQEIRDHLLRYVIVDHKSDIFYFRYYYAAGETMVNLIEFLYEAWSRKADALYPFHGVPLNLYLDKGSANLSHYVQNLCKNLKVELHSHKAGNPRAKGKVECYMKLIQEQFESRLSLLSATSLEEINKHAYEWLVHFCATKKHRRTQTCRTSLWASRITSEQLRVAPEKGLFMLAARSKPFPAMVSTAKTITVDRQEYLIKGAVQPREQVICDKDYYNPLALYCYKRNVDGTRGEQLDVIKIIKNELGESHHAAQLGKEFKRHPDTLTTKEMKAMDELDYTNMAKAAFTDRRDEVGDIAFIERQGTAIEIRNPKSEIRNTAKTTELEIQNPKSEIRNSNRQDKGAEHVPCITYTSHEVFREIRHRLRLERITAVQSQCIDKILAGRERVGDEVVEEIIREVFKVGQAVETVRAGQAVTA